MDLVEEFIIHSDDECTPLQPRSFNQPIINVCHDPIYDS